MNSFEIFQNQIILFPLILKVITSICNETIFLLTEIKCHGGMFSYRVQWLKKYWINDTINRNLTVWELWYFKTVNQLSRPAFSSSYSPYNCYSPVLLLARPTSIKWILLATRIWRVGERSFPALLQYNFLGTIIDHKGCFKSGIQESSN